MSGGVDSALTAALFERAGWRVLGLTLPIEQNLAETERGFTACHVLGIERRHLNLTDLYRAAIRALTAADPDLAKDQRARIQRGNIKTRLRMTTLYNMAAANGGLVVGTDTYSELSAGFSTLHGDVGDVSPIQALLKSWEVPYLARALGLPEEIWSAVPTDRLTTGGTAEQQIGASYLEWDFMVASIRNQSAKNRAPSAGRIRSELYIDNDERAARIFETVLQRLAGTCVKRNNPVQFEHPLPPRLASLASLDRKCFAPRAAAR